MISTLFFQRALNEDNLIGFSSKTLSGMFMPSKRICEKKPKFELRIDNVRFVGYPVSLDLTGRRIRDRSFSPMRTIFCSLLFRVWGFQKRF